MVLSKEPQSPANRCCRNKSTASGDSAGTKELDKNTLKLRQMAVEPGMQGKNLGAALVSFAEQFCTKEGFSIIELNARKEAIGFYLKSGYQVEGDEFEEVGIAHYRMTKTV